MSFFNKMFASVGIGSATVDTQLEKEVVVPGEVLNGQVTIKGGKVDQQVDDIYLTLHTTYLRESDDKKYNVKADIERIRLTEAFTIAAGQTREIPFSFQLPLDTPISIGRTKIWVETGLDIKNAVDPSDKDYIKVVPTPLMEAILDAVNQLGFRLREADCEQASYRTKRRLPFIQEFEFVATSGKYRGRLDELEVVLFPTSNDQVDVVMQIDRKARGLGGFLAEALEMDETNVKLTVTTGDMSNLITKLDSVIQRYA